ncbi:thioesterase domain-containing protein, partial [Mucilaginibacter sp. RCC_168]|uniref:thioesterase domain-containing protein n=1 Tax=Mucilaginibacter sp. RCC_168 TaxID=3239221 RepID=UPI00352644EF
LAAIWTDLLAVERVGIHDNFFQLGGHSLLAMRLVSSIRKEMAIGLSINDLFKNPTIVETVNYIKSNIGKLILKKMPLESDHIVQVSSGKKGKIIFFVSGITGIYGGLDDLAQELSRDFQIYGLQMIGLFEKESPLKTIEEIAAQNIKWMKTIQPNGPYCFLGHSYAGYIVYEMAKQLAKSGEEIDLPLILDTSPNMLNHSENSKENFILFTGAMFENYNLFEKVYPDWTQKLKEELLDIATEKTPAYLEKILKNLFPKVDENINFVIRVVTLQANNNLIRYEIKEKINIEGIIISASESPHVEISEWSKYFERYSIFTIQGTHGSIVKGANAIEITRLIKEHIALKNKSINR